VKINRSFDPGFTRAFDRARRVGVEFIGVRHTVSPRGLGPPIPIPVLV
jgi:DNA-binding sugar fermentation-stimulating protein